LRVDCEVVRRRDRVLLASRTLDLSIDGMLVPTGQRVLTGEEVFVSFEIPGVGEWFDGTACVARVDHGRRPTDRGGRCLGIVFDDQPRHVRALLASVLARLPEALPRRRPPHRGG
jgi:Tfp pilus assembly protein PilZ